MNEIYMITLSADGIGSVTVLPAETPAQVLSGYGGWTVISRERRVGLTLWQGKDPMRMAVPVIFEGYRDRISQEVQISRLSRMALPPTVGGEPPTVTISGRSLPKPGPTHWVIESLAWGTNVVWDFASNGVLSRLRQDCVINLLEYRGADRVAFKGLLPGKAAPKNSSSKSGWPRTYTVKQHDTLRTIAARKDVYGNASKWKLIAKANNIRDLNSVKVGRKLRLPAP